MGWTAAQAGDSWEIQVDNLSPPGHVWGFNAFYPDRLSAHAGDTLTFRVAENVNAFHHVTLMPAGFLPAQGYPGFVFPDPYVPGGYQTTFFNNGPNFSQEPGATLCGRAGEALCPYTGKAAVNSGVLLAPPPESGARGNRSFAVAIDPSLAAGSYFFLCLVHGPAMNGRIDVRPVGAPLQSLETLRVDAARAFEDDLLELDRAERAARAPSFHVEQDGSKTWLLPVGGGAGRLSVDQFGVESLLVKAGDAVVWTMEGPSGVAHTVSGFVPAGEQLVRLPVYDPACEAPLAGPGPAPMVGARMRGRELPPPRTGERGRPDPDAPSRFDVWNGCRGDELALLTTWAFPPAGGGGVYTGGPISSGILRGQAFLESPAGFGAPFSDAFNLRFPTAGTYRYACAVHEGMTGAIVVQEP